MGKARVIKKTKFDGISLLDNGKYQIVVRPWGLQGPRKQATTLTLADAKIERDRFKALGEKKPESIKQDKRKLSELLELWWSLHGQNLKDGKARKGKLENFITSVGDIQAVKLTGAAFGRYREERLENGATARTVNRDHSYLRAMFNTLDSFDQWHHPNPVSKIKLMKESEVQLTYLDQDERKRLLSACDRSRSPHIKLMIMIGLATGARWSEINSLKRSQVKGNRIQFVETKNDKRRLIPIPEELAHLLKTHKPESSSSIFPQSRSAFEAAIERANIRLPKGQLTHVLRHSFAVTFMEEGGSIHVLQKILGHSHISTTAIYLAFAPDNLDKILELNPLKIDGVEIKLSNQNELAMSA
ncbi:phage integrase [Alteromonas sp. a30]|uniref:phage integrase n=1 Tax=Alteromonas sp. a30 TaxID=2730917 RepID=UPI00227E6F7C|nr:tyrosine-type recombinase/integrase [Alteromonas sp. a30]MCY7295080.1 tyrosine-type recombinase/integrase [Alteromonas sp. a30]